ncbi:hypothetical protein GCM10009554_04220 [Kribbella koreensis]|uniref:Secreted protein n=1 Tax=Kribbella koreensis TaxID=57909 RepID=A0ABN1P9U4_9ACTN
MRNKLSVLGMVGALLIGVLTVGVAAPANATVTGCTARRIAGSPYPGGESLCTDRSHQVLLTCKKGAFNNDEDSWLGPVAAKNKTSRKFCTSEYPVFVSADVWYL